MTELLAGDWSFEEGFFLHATCDKVTDEWWIGIFRDPRENLMKFNLTP